MMKGKKERAFCDACAFSKTTSAPALTGRPQAESVKKTTESRLELWEETSYDVSGHCLTLSIDGGHKCELWCIDHATDAAHCQGFQRPGQSCGVIEEFLDCAETQRQHARATRKMNLMIEESENGESVRKGKMKGDFLAMHRSKRMQAMMRQRRMESVIVAPNAHHEMGRAERAMRTHHESAMANLAMANLPSKCRCHAVKHAMRRYDHLPRKANPEQFSRRAMRRTMMGMVTAMHQQMVPAMPCGVPACPKNFTARKEMMRVRAPGTCVGCSEERRTHMTCFQNAPGHEKDFMMETGHCAFDLSLPVAVENHTTMVVGPDEGEVQRKLNARTERFNDMGNAGDTCEAHDQTMSESTVLDLAQPGTNVNADAAEESPEDMQSEGRSDEEEKENEGSQKEGEPTGEGAQQDGALTGMW